MVRAKRCRYRKVSVAGRRCGRNRVDDEKGRAVDDKWRHRGRPNDVPARGGSGRGDGGLRSCGNLRPLDAQEIGYKRRNHVRHRAGAKLVRKSQRPWLDRGPGAIEDVSAASRVNRWALACTSALRSSTAKTSNNFVRRWPSAEK